MNSKSQEEAVWRVTEIEIGLAASAVVCVEREVGGYGGYAGYLIAEAYERGEMPSEVMLLKVIYLHLSRAPLTEWVRVTGMESVIVSKGDRWWTAVEPREVLLVPCPASVPYPIIFISNHGFRWMQKTIEERQEYRVLEHLEGRFAGTAFETCREVLTEPGSPFEKMELLKPRLVKERRKRRG